MHKTTRIKPNSMAVELDFVDAVHTRKPVMEFAIELHLAGLSLSDAVSFIERFGVSRARSTIHTWVKNTDLEPRGGCSPDTVALDKTVFKIHGEQFWLVGAVVPSTTRILHVGLYTNRYMAMIEFFLDDLNQKHDVQDAVFLVDGAPWLHADLHRFDLQPRHETFGERNPIERVFQEIKRRTSQFYNHFGHAKPESIENWLLALAWAGNNLI
jgi:transposase-like protein